jgi:hypothetical protein
MVLCYLSRPERVQLSSGFCIAQTLIRSAIQTYDVPPLLSSK